MHAPSENSSEQKPKKLDYTLHSVGGNGSLVDRVFKNRVRVTGFGRLYQGVHVNWSFRPFQEFGDGEKRLPSARRLPQVAESLGLKKILAPKPVFGTNACWGPQLRTAIRFEREGYAVMLMRGIAADICVLEPGETFGITAAGCPVGWMYHPNKQRVVVAHMGLKCLIDLDKVLGGEIQKTRKHDSVIERMWELLDIRAGEADAVQAGYDFPIQPAHYKHQWNHRKHGAKNQKLCEHIATKFGSECILGWEDEKERRLGRIELGLIIRRQYKACGILHQNIHSTGAPETLDLQGKPVWYDTRGPFKKESRNLILVSAL